MGNVEVSGIVVDWAQKQTVKGKDFLKIVVQGQQRRTVNIFNELFVQARDRIKKGMFVTITCEENFYEKNGEQQSSLSAVAILEAKNAPADAATPTTTKAENNSAYWEHRQDQQIRMTVLRSLAMLAEGTTGTFEDKQDKVKAAFVYWFAMLKDGKQEQPTEAKKQIEEEFI